MAGKMGKDDSESAGMARHLQKIKHICQQQQTGKQHLSKRIQYFIFLRAAHFISRSSTRHHFPTLLNGRPLAGRIERFAGHLGIDQPQD